MAPELANGPAAVDELPGSRYAATEYGSIVVERVVFWFDPL